METEQEREGQGTEVGGGEGEGGPRMEEMQGGEGVRKEVGRLSERQTLLVWCLAYMLRMSP